MDCNTKKCSRCGEVKEFGEFYKKASSRDGFSSICKACSSKAGKQWRIDNKDRDRETHRKYAREHKEQQDERVKKWVKNNPERRREIANKYARSHPLTEEQKRKKRQRYHANPEKHREDARKYRNENKEQRNESTRLWRQRNPEKVQENTNRRRAYLLETSINDFTKAQWVWLKEEYNYRCAYCGCTPDKLEIEHVIPLSRGGLHTMSNIVPSCRLCNQHKNDKTPEEAGMFFVVIVNQLERMIQMNMFEIESENG